MLALLCGLIGEYQESVVSPRVRVNSGGLMLVCSVFGKPAFLVKKDVVSLWIRKVTLPPQWTKNFFFF